MDGQPGMRTTITTVGLERFKAGMRRLAAGVCLVTTRHEGQRHGLLATSVTSLSAEPPSLLVCVNRAASGHDPVIGAGHFCVNVLAQSHKRIAMSFGDATLRHTRFIDGVWDERCSPVLDGALAAFECRLDRTLAYGSHTILIGLIDAIRLDAVDLDPLMYFDGSFQAFSSKPDRT